MKTTIKIDTELFLQLHAVLSKLIEEHPYSKEFADIDENHPFFLDSCNFVGVLARIGELSSWLYGMARFVEKNKEIFPTDKDDVQNG